VKPRLHPPSTASALLAVMVLACATPVAAQRVSVADRVAMLEQRAADADAANSSANIERLNQITEMRAELRELRGQIETLEQQNAQLKATMRSQYLDLDDRMQGLERTHAAEAVIVEPDTTPSASEPATAPAQDALAEASPETADSSDPSTDDAAEPAPDPAQERASYEAAFDALKSGRYPEAARLFQAFLQTFPDGTYAANARYWLGESYYVIEDYARAQAEFEALIARWPEHDKTPGALLKIGLSQHGQKQYDDAEATLLEVGQRYPGTDAARIAADRLRAIQLSRLK